MGISLNPNRVLQNKLIYVGLVSCLLLYLRRQWKYTSRFFHNCSQIKGEGALVPGANFGIGYEISSALNTGRFLEIVFSHFHCLHLQKLDRKVYWDV